MMRALFVAAFLGVLTFPVVAGEYILRTDPPAAGASVFVDGTFAGVTDDNGKIVVSGEPGTHEIRLDHAGETYASAMYFDPDINSVEPFVIPETTTDALIGAEVDYLVDTNVGDALVLVGGEVRGRTDSAGRVTLRLLPQRQYAIEIRKAGFETQKTTIGVPATGGQLSVALRQQVAATRGVDGVLFALIALLLGSIVLLLFVAFRHRRGAAARAVTGRSTGVVAAADAGHFDRYQLAGTLGSGGIGTIYRAMDLVQKTLVALKILDARWLSDPDMVRKFLAEGEALRAIAERDSAAAVVKCYRFGREHDSIVGRPFIALELLEGETLQSRLTREPVLDEQTYVGVAYQLANALVPVHGSGIVHRDLTPDNVFLRKGDVVVGTQRFTSLPVVVLIDFGIARQELLSRMTMDGSIAGKPHFMSPEQCRGLTVDARSDLYSMGIILYLMAAGRLPFGGRDVFEVMRAQQSDEPPPLPAQVNVRYAEFCRRLLKKDRDERPSSATSVASELAEILLSISTAASMNIVSFPDRRVSL